MRKAEGDHRTRVTKRLIRDAFLSRLARQPLQSITVKALCADAGINRGTFYAHYQDLYALLEQLEDEMLGDFLAALTPIYEGVDLAQTQSLVDICTGIFQCLKDNADLCTVMLGEHADKAFVRRLLALGKETCLRVYSRHFVNAGEQAITYYYAFVSEGCVGLLRQWLLDGMMLPARDVAQMAESIMLRGIGFLSGPAREV